MAHGAAYEPKAVPLSGAIVAVVIAALAGFIVGKVFAGPTKRAPSGDGGRAVVVPLDAAKAAKLATEGDPPAKGPASAKVKVVLFSDFQCPFCKNAAGPFEDLAKKFGDKIQIVYRPFPLPGHKGADLAAEAALAANEQGKFWEYHDVLYAHMDAQTRSDLEPTRSRSGWR